LARTTLEFLNESWAFTARAMSNIPGIMMCPIGLGRYLGEARIFARGKSIEKRSANPVKPGFPAGGSSGPVGNGLGEGRRRRGPA
jgi:hypothetical protein